MGKKIIRRTPAEVYELWVAALRSGKYKQGRGVLHKQDKFCCLGVLCDLAAKDGGPQWKGHPNDTAKSYMGKGERLPKKISRFMNLDEEREETLMRMNDVLEKSFFEIADVLEEHAYLMYGEHSA